MKDRPKMNAVDGGGITRDEAELLAAFRMMDNRGRDAILCGARAIAEDTPRQRPALTIVRNTHRGGMQ